jgi:hypothetical protein
MIEFSPGMHPFLYFLVGLGLVAISAVFRLGPSFMDEATNDWWRFGFFIAWTLFLPFVWLIEWYGPDGYWLNPPNPILPFTYGRKVISDVWTAVAAVLGLLAWNKKP